MPSFVRADGLQEMAAEENDTSGTDPVPADKETLSSRMRELILRSKAEERRKPENEKRSEGESRRRGDTRDGSTHD